MTEYEARCMKCKKTVKPVKNPEIVEIRKGVNAVKGKCPVCNGNVFRIIGKAKND